MQRTLARQRADCVFCIRACCVRVLAIVRDASRGHGQELPQHLRHVWWSAPLGPAAEGLTHSMAGRSAGLGWQQCRTSWFWAGVSSGDGAKGALRSEPTALPRCCRLGWRDHASRATTPKLYTSAFGRIAGGTSRMRSGAAYAAPYRSDGEALTGWISSVTAHAWPKSMSLPRLSAVSMMLCGFTSRWAI